MKSRISTFENLRAIAEALEFEFDLYKQKATARKKRAVRVLDGLLKIVKRELKPFCNCRQITVVNKAELQQFAEEMAVSCPIHGPNRLGVIVAFGGYLSDGDPRDLRLQELIKEYRRRCFILRK